MLENEGSDLLAGAFRQRAGTHERAAEPWNASCG